MTLPQWMQCGGQFQNFVRSVPSEHKNTQEYRERKLLESQVTSRPARVCRLETDPPSEKKSETGLYYKIEKEGEGRGYRRPYPLLCQLHRTFYRWQEFDSSRAIRQLRTGVVPGFGEGLKMLKRVERLYFMSPASSGYGVSSMTAAGIGPQPDILVFDVGVGDPELNLCFCCRHFLS